MFSNVTEAASCYMIVRNTTINRGAGTIEPSPYFSMVLSDTSQSTSRFSGFRNIYAE